MMQAKRRPVSVGEILAEEFMSALEITQGHLASAMGVSGRTVNELCTNRRSITVDTALMLAKVFGNTPDFRLNLQQRNDIWAVLHSAKRMAGIDQAKSIAKQRPEGDGEPIP